jgi:uncharacterized protein (TIGR02453 family)
MPNAPTFRPAALDFLRGLARDNSKPWFEAHRDAYEAEVRAPLLDLVDEIDARLGTLAPELVGDRKKSVFRIHRDVRFSKDKRPYKTNAACWFFHRDVGRAGTAGGHVHGGAGFYFQLEPGNSFTGGGLWMPPRDELRAIRERIAGRHEELERIVTAAPFRKRFGALETEGMLTRVPRGWEADHPAAAWLRYTSFTAGRPLTDEEVLAPKLAERVARDFAALVPLVRWLNGALGLQPAERR